MKSCMIILVFMTCFIESVLSQGLVDKSADTGLMVRQIPNTESAAIKFLLIYQRNQIQYMQLYFALRIVQDVMAF